MIVGVAGARGRKNAANAGGAMRDAATNAADGEAGYGNKRRCTAR
jgi:hypothetical protein